MKLRARGLQSSDPEHIRLYGQFPTGLLYSYNPLNTKKFPVDKEYPNDFNGKVYYQLVGADGDFKVKGDIGNFDVTKHLRDLKMPVLILAGRYDRVAVPKFTVLFKSYCPQATFIMFEHSGHWPQLEEPEKTFSAITSFLKK
jgi:proline iminopeptidase